MMEPLTLKPRQPVQDDIECWDDDDDLQGIEDLQFRNVSSTTIGTNASTPLHHRDSISSRRSDVDGDEDWQVLLGNDDDATTSNAIASAKSAGIPIPASVPTSALLGGTIKRLGGRRLKKVLGDDWSEDLELPRPGDGGLKLKKSEGQESPDALRQISAAFLKTPDPAKPQSNLSFMERIQMAGKAKATVSALDKFRDTEEDGFGDVPTIKIAKIRLTQKTMPINFMPAPVKKVKAEKVEKEAENFEDDLVFPTDGEPLKLSARKEIPKTPASQLQDDFDAAWAEGSQGSLGTSHGGSRRTGKSNRSSSFSALSPSVFSPSLSSCMTAESEDEGLEGLVLPDGPIKFQEALNKRIENASPDPTDGKKVENRVAAKEDFFSGLEIGDGDVFDSGKLTLNRNIKLKATRQTSPKRTATTLTFTNKPQSAPTIKTRIPKPQPHDRNRSKLEPVSESGGPIPDYRRSQSRVGNHSAQSSVSAIPAPATTIPSAPSTPSRRGLNSKFSTDGLRTDPTTTHAQLLKAKRSMPAIKTQPSPARTQPSYQRPPSRSEYHSRVGLPPRPKTPIDRSGAESSLANGRKPPFSTLPAGNSHTYSHHLTSKTSRTFRRPNSSDSNENVPFNRPLSRVSNPSHRPVTPNTRRGVAPKALAKEAASKRTLTKPLRRRAFGDGSELEAFDDLPTSATVESKFVKRPTTRGPKSNSNLRGKLNASQNPSLTSLTRTETSGPQTPLSPTKFDSVPSWARDTAASRLAREQRVGSVNPLSIRNLNAQEPKASLANLSTNWKGHATVKPTASPRHTSKRPPKPQQKPNLIKGFGNGAQDPKTVKGMHWNPTLYRWEGNENALAPFDVALLPDSPSTAAGLGIQTKPALIANVGSVKGVQVVGGMVFDPQRMCWLKNPGHHNIASRGNRSESNGGLSPATEEDEEDPFAGMDDLEDKTESTTGRDSVGLKDGDNEWLVGEEFDVGPEFVRRQRIEEEKWARKVEGWVGDGAGRDNGDGWKWAIRGLVGR